MNKLITIVIALICSFQSFAQDPELYRTWYLYYVYMDFEEPYFISDISPPIHPFLTIEEDLSFVGEGACNTFSGTYEYLGGNSLNYLSFNNTNDDCGVQTHNFFENDYFGFIPSGYEYYISQESDGLTLHLESPLFSGLTFKEFPLSTSDFIFNDINIYPNPVSDKLFISSENYEIEKVIIYSISGKKIQEMKDINVSIDVSNLSEGLYFIELSTSEGKSIQKFIKR